MELKERFIRLIKEEATFLQELGVCDDRAKLQFKDAIMNHSPGKQLALEAAPAAIPAAAPTAAAAPAAVPTALIAAPVAAPVAAAAAQPSLFTLSDVLQMQLQKSSADSTKLAVRYGKAVAQHFRDKYNTDPKTNLQYVNGRRCPVKAYEAKDVTDWIVPKLNEWTQNDVQ